MDLHAYNSLKRQFHAFSLCFFPSHIGSFLGFFKIGFGLLFLLVAFGITKFIWNIIFIWFTIMIIQMDCSCWNDIRCSGKFILWSIKFHYGRFFLLLESFILDVLYYSYLFLPPKSKYSWAEVLYQTCLKYWPKRFFM